MERILKLSKEIKENRYAIYVNDSDVQVQELCCKMCLHLLRKKDFDSIQKYGVCLDCMFDFVEPNMEGWKNGERPTEETVNQKLSQRLDNPFFFVRDRPI